MKSDPPCAHQADSCVLHQKPDTPACPRESREPLHTWTRAEAEEEGAQGSRRWGVRLQSAWVCMRMSVLTWRVCVHVGMGAPPLKNAALINLMRVYACECVKAAACTQNACLISRHPRLPLAATWHPLVCAEAAGAPVCVCVQAKGDDPRAPQPNAARALTSLSWPECGQGAAAAAHLVWRGRAWSVCRRCVCACSRSVFGSRAPHFL